ncbi:MAG TPA: hypothetical protein VL860_00385 [Planctomycetota bacterium]|nr:hypothetical protein [Planctomycetota bacterium]
MYASLTFDTEDYTSPEHWGMDDIPKWLSEIMTEEGLTGTFLMIGHKSRSIRDRKRRDVIAAMRKHEIGVHTNFGSDHPTLAEALAPLEWHEAVEHAIQREGPYFKELGEIFDTNVGAFSTHGASQAAPMHYVAGTKFDRPWLYSFATTPKMNNCWFAHCFQFGMAGIGISEADYSQPSHVDETLKRWDKQVHDLAAAGHKWILIFMAHPLMIRCKQFNDALNYADGKNRWPWVTPEMRTPQEMEVAKVQFRRVCKWIAKHPKLTNLSLYDTYRKLGLRKAQLYRSELAAYAQVARKHETILTGYTFSPGEALLSMAEGLLAKSPPNATQVRDVLGPIGESPRMPDNYLSYLNADHLKLLARGLMSHFHGTGMLPSALPCPNSTGRIGLPSIFHVITDGWLQLHEGATELKARVPNICNRYPKDTDVVEARSRKAWLNWPIHDINMPLENLSRHMRLQCWTWKDIYTGSDKPQYPEGEGPHAAKVTTGTPAAHAGHKRKRGKK